MVNYRSNYLSPLGNIMLISDGKFLTHLIIEGQRSSLENCDNYLEVKLTDLEVFLLAKDWLDDYFSFQIPKVDVPLKLDGSLFQKMVWNYLESIPYGEVSTYGEIAKCIAKAKNISKMSAQAVGRAVGKNPISILVPCHREVVRSIKNVVLIKMVLNYLIKNILTIP